MLRTLTLTLAAVAAIGTASLAPTTTASAGWKGHHGHGHHHHFGHKRFYSGPVHYAGDYGCWRKRFIDTPYGVIVKRVNVCY